MNIGERQAKGNEKNLCLKGGDFSYLLFLVSWIPIYDDVII